jgi:hypothetical protein
LIFESNSICKSFLLVQKSNIFDEYFLEDFSILGIELIHSNVDSMFPKSYPFLIPNLSLPQTYIRDQPPSFIAHPSVDYLSDTQFDIITLGKMSLSSNPTFRRCSNFSRVFTSKPYPFLVDRLNNKCLCGGLFLVYTHSNTSEISNVNITK